MANEWQEEISARLDKIEGLLSNLVGRISSAEAGMATIQVRVTAALNQVGQEMGRAVAETHHYPAWLYRAAEGIARRGDASELHDTTAS